MAHQASLDAHRQTLDQLDQSRRAADTWLIGLSGSLQFYPGLDAVREKLIGDAITHYQALLDSNSFDDPAPRKTGQESWQDVSSNSPQQQDLRIRAVLEKAKVHIRLGDLFRLQGIETDATDHYVKAEQALIETAQFHGMESARMDDLKVQLANCSTGLVLLGRRSDQDCQNHIQWLRSRLTQLNSKLPTGPLSLNAEQVSLVNELVSSLARSNLAICRRNLGGQPKSSCGQVATQWAKWLVENRGSDADYRLLQTSLAEWARSQLAEKKFSEAAKTWRQLVNQLEESIGKFPQRVDHWQALAHTRIQLANALSKSQAVSEQSEAADQLNRAIKDLNQAWELSDGQGFFLGNLAAAENNLGKLLSNSKNPSDSKEAADHFVRSLDYRRNIIRQNPTIAEIRRYCQTIHSLSAIQSLDVEIALRYLNEADVSFQIIKDQGQLTRADQKVWDKLQQTRAKLQQSAKPSNR